MIKGNYVFDCCEMEMHIETTRRKLLVLLQIVQKNWTHFVPLCIGIDLKGYNILQFIIFALSSHTWDVTSSQHSPSKIQQLRFFLATCRQVGGNNTCTLPVYYEVFNKFSTFLPCCCFSFFAHSKSRALLNADIQHAVVRSKRKYRILQKYTRH